VLTPIALPVDLNLLQAQRLLHACMEAGLTVAVPLDQRANMEFLERVFGRLPWTDDTSIAVRVQAGLDHAAPRVWIGSLERPLIFARAIVARAAAHWSERTLKFAFTGLVTEQRRSVLEQFARAVDDELPDPTAHRLRIRGRLIGRDRALPTMSRGEAIALWASRRGRQFPGKLWDEGYYRTLGRAQFVLCPNGDYTWSYRFYESCLCGAIPVVEDSCPAYEGFRFLRMRDDGVRDAEWSERAAVANRALAIERLTIEPAALRDAVAAAVA